MAPNKGLVLGHERMRVKAAARTSEVDWVHVWTLRAGRLVAFREYTDTATIEKALRGA